MYRNMKIAIVIPAYNEEMLIEETLANIPNFVDKIYVIDDSSTDKTFELLNSRAKTNPKLVVIRHESNKGVGAAIITGYKNALKDNMEIAAVMAGDNQMDPAYLPDFLDPIIDGFADYTKGNRLTTRGNINAMSKWRGMSKWRFLGNSILTFLTKLSSGYWQVMDPQNGYTAISATALKKLDLDSIYPRYGYCNNILAKMNVFNLKIMNVSHPPRYGSEKSKIKYGSYILRVSRLLLADFLWRLKIKYVIANFHPLVLFYLSGAILAIVGIFGVIYSLYYKFVLLGSFFEKGVLSFIIFVVGLQFFLFGMVFDKMQDRQHYISTNEQLGTISMNGPFNALTHEPNRSNVNNIINIPMIRTEVRQPEAHRADCNIGSRSPVENISSIETVQ